MIRRLALVLVLAVAPFLLLVSPAEAARSDSNWATSVTVIKNAVAKRGRCARAKIEIRSYVSDGLYGTVEVFNRFGESVDFQVINDFKYNYVRPLLCAGSDPRGTYRVVYENEIDDVEQETLRVTFNFRIRR